MLTLFENGVIKFLHDEHISTHHSEENNCPILQMGELVRERRGGDTQTSPFSSRNELTGTTSGSSPCLLQNPWSFAPLLILSLFNLVQLSHTVSWPAFCWLELRPVPSHIHTHTLFLAQLQNNLHVHIYDLSYTSLSMVLLNI